VSVEKEIIYVSIKFTEKLLLSVALSASLGALVALAKEPAEAKNTDAAFLSMAAQADMTAAHLGQMAQNRAVTNPLKDFGKTLTDDHTSDYHALTALSTKTGETIPKAIDKQNVRVIENLDRLHGKTFDRQFLANQTLEHEKLIKAFKQEADHGSNPDIKSYANKTLPVLERHLHEAQDLVKNSSAKG
jgi:putative membrane protein